jgi:fucose 4-O-acetylase-like acetyltransferase
MEKLKWLLILQGWAMLWVVIGHSDIDLLSKPSCQIDTVCYTIQSILHNFAYSFHMPLFILISGYLLHRTKITKEKSYIEVLKSKWIRLFLPYVTFISLAIAVKYVTGSGYRQLDLTPMGFINNYLYPYDGALREMWFIALLFWLILLYPLYKLLISNKVMSVAGGGYFDSLVFLRYKKSASFLGTISVTS